MSQPTRISDALASGASGFYASTAVETEGGDTRRRVVSRRAQCDCGKSFTQWKLSERTLRIMRFAAERSGRQAAIDREIPDAFVPLLCPRCEVFELANVGRRGNVRRRDTIAEDMRRHDARYEADERAGLEIGV